VRRVVFAEFECYKNSTYRLAGRFGMITVNIRKQGGAAIMTIPADVLKILNVEPGAILELEVGEGSFTARPVRPRERKRYSLAELLRGTTPEDAAALNEDTAWAREGEPVGRELG
jgi:antitoxin ChpS